MPIESDTQVSDIQGVQDSAGKTVPAASDDYSHVGETGADPSGTVTKEIGIPDAAESVVLLAADADDSFSVELLFNNVSISYSGDSTTPVDVERSIVGDTLTVKITGSATTIDYDIYAK